MDIFIIIIIISFVLVMLYVPCAGHYADSHYPCTIAMTRIFFIPSYAQG